MATIRLFVESYDEANPARRAELDHCLAANIANPLIDHVVVLTARVPSQREQGKVEYRHCPERMTFQVAMQVANSLIQSPNDITIIANSDIAFDGTLEQVKATIQPHQCFALSRYDRGRLHARSDSQDAWIFQGPIRESLIGASVFSPGIPGVDNRFAWELNQSGYAVTNPSLQIKIHHHHHSGVRSYFVGQERLTVPGPYRKVPIEGLPIAMDRSFRMTGQWVGFDGTIYRPEGASNGSSEIVLLSNDAGVAGHIEARYGSRCYRKPHMDNPRDQAYLYRGCEIAITDQPHDRMLCAMGSGAFVLVRRSPVVDEQFDEGMHLEMWSDLDELDRKIDYYLAHDNERAAIARQGSARAHLRFSASCMKA